MITIVLIIAFGLALRWNWSGFKDRSRSAWGTPGYVFAFYATILCAGLIFFAILFVLKATGLWKSPY
jgi:Mg2+/citrate symporter